MSRDACCTLITDAQNIRTCQEHTEAVERRNIFRQCNMYKFVFKYVLGTGHYLLPGGRGGGGGGAEFGGFGFRYDKL